EVHEHRMAAVPCPQSAEHVSTICAPHRPPVRPEADFPVRLRSQAVDRRSIRSVYAALTPHRAPWIPGAPLGVSKGRFVMADRHGPGSCGEEDAPCDPGPILVWTTLHRSRSDAEPSLVRRDGRRAFIVVRRKRI